MALAATGAAVLEARLDAAAAAEEAGRLAACPPSQEMANAMMHTAMQRGREIKDERDDMAKLGNSG